MLLLALDCTFGGHSAVLARNGQVIACSHRPSIHATNGLMPSLARLLRRACAATAYMDGIAFGAWPGLFSGIRAACAAAQNSAYAASLRMVAYPAQRNHCYIACYREAGASCLPSCMSLAGFR